MIASVRRYLREQPEHLRDRIQALKRERPTPERSAAKINADIARLQQQLERLAHYAPESNGDDVCPDCLAQTGARHVLQPIASDDPEIDLFRCPECREEWPVRV